MFQLATKIIDLATCHFQLPKRVEQTLREGISQNDPLCIALVMLSGFAWLDEAAEMFAATMHEESKEWVSGYRHKVAEHLRSLLLSAYVKENAVQLAVSFVRACQLSYMRHETAEPMLYVTDQREDDE